MQWTMKMRGLGDHLTNTATTKSYIDAGDIGGLSPAQRWVKDEIKASGLLLVDATIPDEVFHEIKDTANVKKVWDKLKGEFEGKSRSVLVGLGRKFQTTRCSEDDDVRAHFSKLAHLREQLSALGRSVSDDEYVAVLIGSLPSCNDGPIDSESLTSSCDVNNVDITPTAVTRAAIREYEKRTLRCYAKKTKRKMKRLPPPPPTRRGPRRTSNASTARRRGTISQSAGQRAAVMKEEGRRSPKTRTRTPRT
jgi:hypothetical protein